MAKRRPLEPTGDPWEEELEDLLLDHVATEGDLLGRYEAAASSARSPALRFVARLLAEDEKRHHAVMEALVRSVAADRELYDDQPASQSWGTETAGRRCSGSPAGSCASSGRTPAS